MRTVVLLMAQAMVTKADKAALAKLQEKSKKTSKKEKKRPEREIIKRQIEEAAKKHVDGVIVHQAPNEATAKVVCWATGHLFDKDNTFRIPLKPVKSVTTSLSEAEYTAKLPFCGQFISPLAALLFLERNSHICRSQALAQNVIDYYKLDEHYTKSQLTKALGLLSQPPSAEQEHEFLRTVSPEQANLYNIGGNVNKKRPRESSSKEPSAKRARTEKSSGSGTSTVAKTIEDALTSGC